MAREIKVAGKAISVRGLKRKEIRSLKKEGFDIGSLNREQVDDVIDIAFDKILTKKDIDLLEDTIYRSTIKVWKAILAETYGSADEEKNSPASGNGSQTKEE